MRVWLGSSSKMLPRLPKPGLEAHHPPFAQRIDRRVGDLAELLAEEMVQAAMPLGEHGQGRVVTHRAQGLLGIEDHGREDQLEILDRQAVERLATLELAALQLQRARAARGDQILEMANVLDPLAVGLLLGEVILERVVAVEDAGLQVDADHLARADAPLLDDRGVLERHHAGLGAHHQQAVAGAAVAQRPEAVAVHAGDHPATIGGDQRCRPVPGLHDAVAVAEQVLVRLGHGHLVRPGRRHQQRLRQRQ